MSTVCHSPASDLTQNGSNAGPITPIFNAPTLAPNLGATSRESSPVPFTVGNINHSADDGSSKLTSNTMPPRMSSWWM